MFLLLFFFFFSSLAFALVFFLIYLVLANYPPSIACCLACIVWASPIIECTEGRVTRFFIRSIQVSLHLTVYIYTAIGNLLIMFTPGFFPLLLHHIRLLLNRTVSL